MSVECPRRKPSIHPGLRRFCSMFPLPRATLFSAPGFFGGKSFVRHPKLGAFPTRGLSPARKAPGVGIKEAVISNAWMADGPKPRRDEMAAGHVAMPRWSF